MEIKKLTILGKSDATITMIFDNLESLNLFPEIDIINNLNLEIEKPVANPKFNFQLFNSLQGNTISAFQLGVIQVKSKLKVFENFGIDEEKFYTLIHKSACISSTSVLGNGCLVNSLVSVAAHTAIGNFVSINRNASVGHHTTINDFVTINPGSQIAGNVTIGRATQIGMGAIVIDGISIGENSVIGAGSLVTKDIPANVMAYGSPAKIIKEI
ncbi:sugar O-acyltransferase, sialic acid O-acetyltransferase NeuD family [Pseudarcicella hirudinis]|uniref:Sugar O-acyltransferase, sialic acid O-acetyltransferase NeuD family n=1 Tax=Pseudarcicella hirudinis TaxID=1079859 RepID=A0A1I5MEK8_9BACT|nr:acetyltransferase [Pseudarcicella hirudinis]SFP08022.1 sugar O-acyltransferase, sialic acid O-acetyltransferase NeuD family [Pseudarcicella hirudinis]